VLVVAKEACGLVKIIVTFNIRDTGIDPIQSQNSEIKAFTDGSVFVGAIEPHREIVHRGKFDIFHLGKTGRIPICGANVLGSGCAGFTHGNSPRAYTHTDIGGSGIIHIISEQTEGSQQEEANQYQVLGLYHHYYPFHFILLIEPRS
jgi:hypothetical protein